ncbi:MAG: YajQ family cyclic di-GMP-binding protein [Methylococcales bacterium]|nr:MAG: YajQ family cyclic di-GMP-binding protein [Methylococcales bacterium]
MPSFDIISEFDSHEVKNAIDQASKEVTTRFDFKGTNSSFELTDDKLTMISESTFQLQQMFSVVCSKLSRRGIDVGCMEVGDAKGSGKLMRQEITLKQGLDSQLAKKIVKLIKDKKLKVQAAIQGDKVRVTGKKRDDLQEVIQMLRDEKLEMPLQYDNFRD